MNNSNKKKIDWGGVWQRIKSPFAAVGSEPDVDWPILIRTSLILIVISFFWSGYLYFEVTRKMPEKPAPQSFRLLDKASLAELIEKYDKRKEDFDKILEAKPTLPDPSV